MSPSYLTQVFFHGVTIPNRLFPLDTASKAEYLEFFSGKYYCCLILSFLVNMISYIDQLSPIPVCA